jgi:hypothetical protein
MKISLQEFIKTGHFGPVNACVTRTGLRTLLGPPDDFGCPPTSEDKAGIWKYGDMEFHFDSEKDDARLFLVFSDALEREGVDVLHGGKRIDLDTWIIRRDLKQEELEQALFTSGLPFRCHVPSYDERQTLVETEAGVTVGFYHERDGSKYCFVISRELRQGTTMPRTLRRVPRRK